MAAEQFSNNAYSYLQVSVDDTVGVVTVTNEAPFPQVPQFRILVDDEIMLVTAVSGTDFTVTRGAEVSLNGGAAAPHSAGALVTHIISAGALLNVITGPAGAPGTTFRDGSGAPSNSLGINGDFYLDTATGDVYTKAAGVYSVTGNIRGPQGIQGIQGIKGDKGDKGDTGSAAPSYTLSITTDTTNVAATGEIVVTAQVQDGTGGNVSGIRPVRSIISDTDTGPISTTPLIPGITASTGIVEEKQIQDLDTLFLTDATGKLVYSAINGTIRAVHSNHIFADQVFSTPLTYTNIIAPTGYLQFLDTRTLSYVGDGNPVTNFADSSSHHNDMSQSSGGAKPIWRANAGKPYLDLSGAQFMYAASEVCPYTDFTLYIVARFTAGRMLGFENGASGAAGFAWLTGGYVVVRYGGNTYDFTISPFTDSSDHIVAISMSATNKTRSFVNNVAKQTSTSPAWSSASENMHIGSAGSGTFPATGRFYASMIYPADHSDAQRAQVFAYLNSIWSVY